MKNEIRTVLKPENDMKKGLEDLLMSVLETKDDENDTIDNSDTENQLQDGLIGVFESKDDDKCVCLVLDSETLQPFKKTHYGYSPSVLTEPLEGWRLFEVIDDYCYITHRGGVYLQF